MIRKTILMAMVVALGAATAKAQDPRVELSGTAGWTFSDGVNVGTIDESPIQIGPKDAVSWGARLGFNVTPQRRDRIPVRVAGDGPRGHRRHQPELPQTVYHYHGYFAYTSATRRQGAALRPGRTRRHAVRLGSDIPRQVDRRRDAVLEHLGAWASRCSRARSSASVSRPAGRPRTSRRIPRATGATPTGAATRSGIRSSRTSSRSPAGSSSGSERHPEAVPSVDGIAWWHADDDHRAGLPVDRLAHIAARGLASGTGRPARARAAGCPASSCGCRGSRG